MTMNIHLMPNSVIIIHNDTTIIQSTDPRYSEILKTLSNGVDEKAITDILYLKEDKSVPPSLSTKGKDEDGRIEVDLNKGTLSIDNVVMPELLSSKLLDLRKRHKPRSFLLNFWDKLQKNPSQNSINMLYHFLENNGHPIMADGNFIAYKAVTEDLFDHYSQTNKHVIGRVIKMDRDKVNSDPTQTCSHGLHICSWSYLKEFHPGDSTILEVIVDPRDVVSVPIDYNGTKCRVAKYKVYRLADKERAYGKKG